MNIRHIARNFARRHVFECEVMLEGEPVLIPMEDPLVHTKERPYCDDRLCPCHYDQRQYNTTIDRPFEDGLITRDEGTDLFRGRNI